VPSKKLKVSVSLRTTRFQDSVSSTRLGSGLAGQRGETRGPRSVSTTLSEGGSYVRVTARTNRHPGGTVVTVPSAATSYGFERLPGRRHRSRRLAKRASSAAPAAPDMVQADYGSPAEFMGRDDPHNPALAVKNGDRRYRLVVIRKSDLVHGAVRLSSASYRPLIVRLRLSCSCGRNRSNLP
jgi:hypothetical protein